MIRLFISDIDGCLAEPFEPFDHESLAALARLAGEEAPLLPQLSLLSGRAFAYVEAMSQLLATRVPVVFESGGGVFDRQAAEITWNPLFTDDVARQLDEVSGWIHRDIAPGLAVRYDYGKRTQAGVVSGDREAIERAAGRIKQRVSDRYDDLVAFQTSVSVDVMARRITKAQAVAWLADLVGVAIEETAYIGDTEGDLAALAAVGVSFCPANGDACVRQIVSRVTEAPLAAGVLEAFRWCVARNEASDARMHPSLIS